MEAIETGAAIFQWIVIGFIVLGFLSILTLLGLNATGKLPPRWSAAIKGNRRRSGSGPWGSDSNSWGTAGAATAATPAVPLMAAGATRASRK
jgi:hypothetical protein